MKEKVKVFLVCLAIPLLAGALSAWITGDSMKLFEQLDKPLLSPPGWLFPVVWTILYILMGIASYLTAVSEETQNRKEGLAVYGVQLAVNFLWPIFFFHFRWYLFSFFWLLLLWCLVLVTIRYFYEAHEAAGYLMLPYLVWITFAGYLNLFVALMN